MNPTTRDALVVALVVGFVLLLGVLGLVSS